MHILLRFLLLTINIDCCRIIVVFVQSLGTIQCTEVTTELKVHMLNSARSIRFVLCNMKTKQIYFLQSNVQERVTWVWDKWKKCWVRDSHHDSRWAEDSSVRLAAGLVICYVFWPDATVSATNFAWPLKLLTLQPLKGGEGHGGGVLLPSELGRKAPDSAVQVTSSWASHKGWGLWLCAATVCGSALGSSWPVNRSGSGRQGFTSAVIFEVRRREFAQEFLKWEACHPNFSYHAH